LCKKYIFASVTVEGTAMTKQSVEKEMTNDCVRSLFSDIENRCKEFACSGIAKSPEFERACTEAETIAYQATEFLQSLTNRHN
jgi:hypothetical protein